MAKLYDRHFIAGTTELNSDTVPGAWEARIGISHYSDLQSLSVVIDAYSDWYNVEARDVAFRNAETAEWEGTNRGIALVNPRREGMPPGKREACDASRVVWHIPTAQYTPAGPDALYKPLTEAIAGATELTTENTFGQSRVYRQGGEIHFDVFFTDHTVELADETKLTMGVTTSHDYFGSKAHKASVIAFNHETGAVMRDITEPRKRKHTGESVDDVTTWWAIILDQLGRVGERLYETVAEAQAYDVDISDMPTDGVGYYMKLGLPEYIAEPAASRAGIDGGPRSGYHCYKAGITALKNHFNAKTGGDAFKSHLRSINPLLFRPPQADSAVLTACAEEADGRPTLVGSEAAELADRAETVVEGVEYFETERDRLRAMLEDIEDTDDDGDDDDGAGDDGEGEGEPGNESESDDSETAAADGGIWVDDR